VCCFCAARGGLPMGEQDSPPSRKASLDRSNSPTNKGEPKKVAPLAAWSNKAPWYLIDPRTSKYIGRWDVFTSLALIFVAFVTPYEVALLEVAFDALFIINRIVDSIFVIDMFFAFVTVYAVRDVYITSPRKIAWHYLTTWCASRPSNRSSSNTKRLPCLSTDHPKPHTIPPTFCTQVSTRLPLGGNLWHRRLRSHRQMAKH
jgi:hypothetical protein